MNNRKKINISLTEEQKKVIDKVMDMLADANIGLAHDYRDMGDLVAFNSINGTAYTWEKDIIGDDEIWFDCEDVEGELTHLPTWHKDKRIYSFYSDGGFAMQK